MEINLDRSRLTGDRAASDLIAFLEQNQAELSLGEAQLYYDFPILKDADDNVVISKVLILSPRHGLILVNTVGVSAAEDPDARLAEEDAELEHVFSLIYSKLIRSRQLRRSKTELIVPTSSVLFAPDLGATRRSAQTEAVLASSLGQLRSIILGLVQDAVRREDFDELVATVEGAKAIGRPKLRDVSSLPADSKGALANLVESEIKSFEKRQKHGAMSVLDGLQRIRGLAGSGKTVVLAMKAALTHLRDPEARIVYTFSTKSLYQHIQRLITRFYRQFEDSDPDWSRLQVLHAWGGHSTPGVYFNACLAAGVPAMTLTDAKSGGAKDAFDYACQKLLRSEVPPTYDYVFVDEGQDFPASFLQLCFRLAVKHRFVFAYDDLQTIFQAMTPPINKIVPVDDKGRPLVNLTEDVVLYKCYRNPREILVCAHAVGFGLYGDIVQMLENRDQWTDIGYEVRNGDFVEGSPTEIERPEANSLPTISKHQSPEDIVQSRVFDSFPTEVQNAAESIEQDLGDGLRPDDILVVVVDDRNAKSYLSAVADSLAEAGIPSNNIHDDSYGIRDFHREGHVTLSTVHKAKGNEALMVYVLGVDALYSSYAGVRERNVLFTAMTRAKGWVRVSGIGKGAASCKGEIDDALGNFPYLRFSYPGPAKLKIIRRDLAEKAVRKQRAERKLDEVLDEMSQEEIIRFVEQRAIKKSTM